MRLNSKAIVTCVVSALALLSAPYATAQVVAHWGKIVGIDAAQTNNFPFRIRMTAGTDNALPDCENSFAYINSQEENYSATVAVLMTAYVQRTQLAVYTAKDNSGYCHIVFVGS